MLYIKLNGITKCSNMVANILPQTLLPPRLLGSRDQNATFSEHGHVAYQIKWNNECSTMLANVLLAEAPTLPDTRGKKVKIRLFQNDFMLHIKLKGITNAATLFCPQTALPDHGVKRSKFNFFRAWSCCIS